ncbi:divalent-cation tolerance protein CutA [Zwartia panacis]|uniref:divalent-cation tolerance protein CutA n=1 Tax=Zwartia panacis TaxID=2683345 RepID=UPI0025B526BA|nr:divalent-cation tolerance protein CutA [Zwartia panacis]MDN4018334.1 divalent-cation tolerance protein CutA [Zwartia panacis]
MPEQAIVVVMTNVPDLLLAKRIAHLLIEEQLAACVNIGTPMLSIYGWKGEVEGAEEIPMIIKTTCDKQHAMIERLVALHPYDIPEALVMPTLGGYGPYLDWVRSLTSGISISGTDTSIQKTNDTNESGTKP